MYNVVRGSVTTPSLTITSYDGSVEGLVDAAGNSPSAAAPETAGIEGADDDTTVIAIAE